MLKHKHLVQNFFSITRFSLIKFFLKIIYILSIAKLYIEIYLITKPKKLFICLFVFKIGLFLGLETIIQLF